MDAHLWEIEIEEDLGNLVVSGVEHVGNPLPAWVLDLKAVQELKGVLFPEADLGLGETVGSGCLLILAKLEDLVSLQCLQCTTKGPESKMTKLLQPGGSGPTWLTSTALALLEGREPSLFWRTLGPLQQVLATVTSKTFEPTQAQAASRMSIGT